MYAFYVDVKYGYKYDWSIAERCSDVLRIVTGAPDVDFIANDLSGISTGDIYRITVKSENDKLLYIIKTGFTIIPDCIMQKWLQERRIY